MSGVVEIKTCSDCPAIRRDREYGGEPYCSYNVSIQIEISKSPPVDGCEIRNNGGNLLLKIID